MAPAQFLIEVVRLNTSFSLLIAFTSTSLIVPAERKFAELFIKTPALTGDWVPNLSIGVRTWFSLRAFASTSYIV